MSFKEREFSLQFKGMRNEVFANDIYDLQRIKVLFDRHNNFILHYPLNPLNNSGSFKAPVPNNSVSDHLSQTV